MGVSVWRANSPVHRALVTQSRWTNQQLRGGELTGFSNGMDARGAQISKQIAAQENVNRFVNVRNELLMHDSCCLLYAELLYKYTTEL